MKVLSLTQPWASLIAWGEKKIETRSWYTPYRGLLAIHAAKGMPGWVTDTCFHNPAIFEQLFVKRPLTINALPRGAIIAVCRLVDCKRITTANIPPEPEHSYGDYTPGRYAWVLEDVQPLQEPIPARGQQGLWEFDVVGAMKERMQAIPELTATRPPMFSIIQPFWEDEIKREPTFYDDEIKY